MNKANEKGRSTAMEATPGPERISETPHPAPSYQFDPSLSIADLRKAKQLEARQLVPVIKRLYPKYDKMLHSKVEHGDRYGIMLRPDAFSAVCQVFGLEPPLSASSAEISSPPEKPAIARKSDNRQLPCRIQCRLKADELERLQLYIHEEGYDTMQSWLLVQIRKYLKRRDAKKK